MRALGAEVHRGAAQESGWLEIRLNAAASSDPVFSPLNRTETVFQLHQDPFELPEGAELLAGSQACPRQAFRFGRALYAVQFHPEVTTRMTEEWRNELGLPPWKTPPGAYSRLAEICDALIGRWRDLL